MPRTGLNPEHELARLLQGSESLDADSFWRKVVENLSDGPLRLLFIADDIPEPLKRVVEFLNAHMQEIEVLAVEIKRFRGASTQALVPRVIGRNAATSATTTRASARGKLTRESFLAVLPTEEARDVAIRLLAMAEQQGASLTWGSGSVSARVRVEDEYGPRWETVARLAVPGTKMWGSPASDIHFSKGDESLDYDAAAQNIDLWEDRLAKAVSELRSP